MSCRETMRSSYFKVTDKEKFLALMTEVQDAHESDFEFWEEDGKYAFGGNSRDDGIGILDLPDGEDGECYSWISRLADCLPKEEAVIIQIAGHDKLRYITQLSIIVTFDEIKSFDLDDFVVPEARKMLNNPDAKFKLDY